MGLDVHRLPAEVFGMLAAGGSGPAAIALLRRSQYSKHLLLLHGAAAGARAAYDLLALAQRADPAAVTAVVRHPSVGAWAYRTTLALRGGPRFPGATPDGLANIAAAAAVRAGLAAEIEVPARDGLVMLPSLGAINAPGAAVATVRISPAGTEVRISGRCVPIPRDHRETAPGWRPLRGVLTVRSAPAVAFEIVVDDVDPFRMPAVPRLSAGADLSRWRPVFEQAWLLLRRHHRTVAAEVAGMLTTAVPLTKPAHSQVSSSSPEAFGAIAMSEPADPVSLAVTLTHEIQHMKLSAVLDMVRLTQPDDGSRYYAPWREDPRPASGLLQGAYAYLGVTGFWRRQRRVQADPGTGEQIADMEFARWRAAAARVCQVLLASGQLTRHGERFVGGMAQTLRPWCGELVPEKARRLAEEEGERHLACWQARNGPLPVP